MIKISKNEAAYMRANGIYVSMTNRGKGSRSKTYYLTESAKAVKAHKRYMNES